MRSTLFFATLLVAVALAALIVPEHRGVPVADRPPLRTGTLTLVGDSLNVGIEPHLARALPGWRLVAYDRAGRATAEGLAELVRLRPMLAPYVVVSLGTNDSPAAVDGFRADVGRALELIGPGRCIVWPTIWRDGASNDRFNAVLRAVAAASPRFRVVEWARLVEAHPEWLATDGLHGNETGYRERARAVAEAMRTCAPAQTVTER